MRQKALNILNIMIKEEDVSKFTGYEEVGDNTFELQTSLTRDCKHRTWLKFDATGDMELFRVELTHIWGYLDLNVDANVAANQLMHALVDNTGSYQGSSAYFGLKHNDGTFYLTLNAYHHFLMIWRDEDVARALSLILFDLTMGFITYDPSLTILKNFADN
ncbi:MAG: hypothetical protein ABR577_18085 [Pyrinomonadaceae bacterium]